MKNKDALYKIDDAIRKENVKLKIKILQKNHEIERLNNIINKALRKLRTSKDHFKTESENNAVTFTIKILEERGKVNKND